MNYTLISDPVLSDSGELNRWDDVSNMDINFTTGLKIRSGHKLPHKC